MDSILDTVKKFVGASPDDTAFDSDIIMLTNTFFSVLNQLGVGPDSGFMVQDKTNEWAEILNGDDRLEMVKTYICLRAKLVFDPPTSSIVADAIKSAANDLEWRISITPPKTITS